MVHTTPTKALLTTTLRPLVVQLSGPLAQGVRLVEQFLHDEPTPQKMATFEWAMRRLLREVGRRIMGWVLNHVEPVHTAAAQAFGGSVS
jgi:hypothetical protein